MVTDGDCGSSDQLEYGLSQSGFSSELYVNESDVIKHTE